MIGKTHIGKSKIQGKGLMATGVLQPGELIGISHINGVPTDDIGMYYNHSDTPNSYSQLIEGKRYIFPFRSIQTGEEITLDYTKQPELEQPQNFNNMKKRQLGGPTVTETPANTYMNKTQDFIEWIRQKALQNSGMHIMEDGTIMSDDMMQYGGNINPNARFDRNVYEANQFKYDPSISLAYNPSLDPRYYGSSDVLGNQYNNVNPGANAMGMQSPNSIRNFLRNKMNQSLNKQKQKYTQTYTGNANQNGQINVSDTNSQSNTQVTTQQSNVPANYYTYQGGNNQENNNDQYSYKGMPQQQQQYGQRNQNYNPNSAFSGLMQFLPLQFQPYMQGKINVNYTGNNRGFSDQPQVLNQQGNYADIQYRHPIWGTNVPKRIRFGFGFGNDPMTSGKANYIDPATFGQNQSMNKTKTIGLKPGQAEYGKDPSYDEEIKRIAEEQAIRNLNKFNQVKQYGGSFYWQEPDILIPDDGDRLPNTTVPVSNMMPVMMTAPMNFQRKDIQPISQDLSTEDWFNLYHQNPNDPRLGKFKVVADTHTADQPTGDLSTEDWFKLYHENPNDPRLGDYKVVANTGDKSATLPTTTKKNVIYSTADLPQDVRDENFQKYWATSPDNPANQNKSGFDSMSFNDAFGAARKQGLKTFTWKGKSYGTRLKGEPKYGYSKANIGENQMQYGGSYSSQPYTVDGVEFGAPGVNPYGLAYDPLSSQQPPVTQQPDVFTMDPNQNQPAFDEAGNAKNPLYTYNGPSGNIQGDIKFKQGLTGESMANLALTGIDFATYLANQGAMNDASKKMRRQFQDVTNMYQPTDEMNRGDWFSLGLKQGALRPNQENFAGPYAFAQYGGSIKNGDEMYLTDEQIQQILDAGGDIEYID